MKAIERLFEYFEAKGIKPTNFEKEANFSNGYFGKMLSRQASIGSDIIEKIIDNCPDLNIYWLLSGIGKMLIDNTSDLATNLATNVATNPKSQNQSPQKGLYPYLSPNAGLDDDSLLREPHTEYITTVVDTKGNEIIPITNIKAAAGAGYLNSDSINADDSIQLPARLLTSGHHICVRVKGDSMAPTLQDSAYIVIRLIERSEWRLIKERHIYVVSDTDGKVCLKRIKNRFDKGFIVLMSDNPDKATYPNFNLTEEEIHTIWHVEWYISARMPNIHDNFYSKVTTLEDSIEMITQELSELRKSVRKLD